VAANEGAGAGAGAVLPCHGSPMECGSVAASGRTTGRVRRSVPRFPHGVWVRGAAGPGDVLYATFPTSSVGLWQPCPLTAAATGPVRSASSTRESGSWERGRTSTSIR